MGWSRKRTLNQSYKVTVNHELFFDKISELLSEVINDRLDNYELEVEEIDNYNAYLSGTYQCDCRVWHSPQTLYDPEEYEIEREYLEHHSTDKNLKQFLVNHAEELINLLSVHLEEDENDAWVENE